MKIPAKNRTRPAKTHSQLDSPIAIGKRLKSSLESKSKRARQSVSMAEIDDGSDEDYAQFMDEGFWKPVVDARRKIKSLYKEIEKHEQVLKEHYVRLTGFFVIKE